MFCEQFLVFRFNYISQILRITKLIKRSMLRNFATIVDIWTIRYFYLITIIRSVFRVFWFYAKKNRLASVMISLDTMLSVHIV